MKIDEEEDEKLTTAPLSSGSVFNVRCKNRKAAFAFSLLGTKPVIGKLLVVVCVQFAYMNNAVSVSSLNALQQQRTIFHDCIIYT